jgi:F-type H+-transporting ATPase subunit epsilon
MADVMTVSVVSPVKMLKKVDASMVVAPTLMGEVGILPQHRALLAALGTGELVLHTSEGVERFAVSGGFLEVHGQSVTLLPEVAEHVSDIQLSRAQQSLKDAESRLLGLSPFEQEYQEQQDRAQRARNRIAVASKRS